MTNRDLEGHLGDLFSDVVPELTVDEAEFESSFEEALVISLLGGDGGPKSVAAEPTPMEVSQDTLPGPGAAESEGGALLEEAVLADLLGEAAPESAAAELRTEPAPPPVPLIPKITDLIRTAWSGIIRQEPLNVLPEGVERILGKSIHTATTSAARQPWQLYALVGVISIQNMLVILGNTPRMSVWLLTLLAVGVGQGCLLPSAVGWLGGLATVVVWVLFRRATGVWVSAELFQSIFEVVGLSLSLALAIWIRHNWERLQRELRELRPLREVLIAGEVGTGLLPREVGELRMIEEVDRSRVFRRPLGLLLVEIEPLPIPSMSLVELKEVFQALNRQLSSVSLVHDIPFRAASNRMGLIMPEREWDKLYDDAESVVNVLKQGAFLDGEGRPQSVLDYVKLNFGVGTYQGEAEGAIDLMRAAEDSLSISRDLAHLGEISVSAYAMPATPIAESDPIRTYAEEQGHR